MKIYSFPKVDENIYKRIRFIDIHLRIKHEILKLYT